MSVSPPNPCLSCGACCAMFRVSFYWAETTLATPEGVPDELTEQVSPYYVAMRGTNQPAPRCVALEGEVGQAVSCSIHTVRSSTCRAFTASWSDGQHHPDCDRARARHGMAALTPADWLELLPAITELPPLTASPAAATTLPTVAAAALPDGADSPDRPDGPGGPDSPPTPTPTPRPPRRRRRAA